MKRQIILAAAVAAFALPASARELDQTAATAALAEARALCEADGGQLWGASLCGPLLIADPRTRAVIANQAGAEGGLTASDGVFTGVLPADINIANTAVEWDGVRWTMLMAPLPDDAESRGALLMHESFHRIQPVIGLPAASPAPAHLGTAEGRILMRLEWRALAAALNLAAPADRRQAMADALVFRAARRDQAGPAGAGEERALELNEGLAEYTGLRLAASEPERTAAAMLRAAEGGSAYARSFAYASGPAYGLLLDDVAPGWRSGLEPGSDLGALLAGALGQTPAWDAAAVQAAAARYDGQAIAEEEVAAAEARAAEAAAWTARLVEAPVLRLPFQQMRISFDPNTLVPLEPHGTVYPTLRVVDAWGILEVSDGALIDPNWSSAVVAAPADAATLSGEGWTLQLNDGWRLAPGEREGDFTLEQTPE